MNLRESLKKLCSDFIVWGSFEEKAGWHEVEHKPEEMCRLPFSILMFSHKLCSTNIIMWSHKICWCSTTNFTPQNYSTNIPMFSHKHCSTNIALLNCYIEPKTLLPNIARFFLNVEPSTLLPKQCSIKSFKTF